MQNFDYDRMQDTKELGQTLTKTIKASNEKRKQTFKRSDGVAYEGSKELSLDRKRSHSIFGEKDTDTVKLQNVVQTKAVSPSTISSRKGSMIRSGSKGLVSPGQRSQMQTINPTNMDLVA